MSRETIDYPARVAKSEAMHANWEQGDGDMDELAIGLYDLIAHYKALYEDYLKGKDLIEFMVEFINAEMGELPQYDKDEFPEFIRGRLT